MTTIKKKNECPSCESKGHAIGPFGLHSTWMRCIECGEEFILTDPNQLPSLTNEV